jgi:hypothetical protein
MDKKTPSALNIPNQEHLALLPHRRCGIHHDTSLPIKETKTKRAPGKSNRRIRWRHRQRKTMVFFVNAS